MKKSILKTVSVLLAALLVFSIIFTGCSDGSDSVFSEQNIDAAVESEMNYVSLEEGFTTVKVIDEQSAIAAVQSISSTLGIEDAQKELKVKDIKKFDDATYYTMQQYYDDIPVYGKTVTLSASEDGEATALTANTSPAVPAKMGNKKLSVEKIENLIQNRYGESASVLKAISEKDLCYYVLNNTMYLCYSIEVKTENGSLIVFVDAYQGKVIDELSRTFTELSDTTVACFNKGKSIKTTGFYSASKNRYELYDEKYGTYIWSFEKTNSNNKDCKQTYMVSDDNIFGNTKEEQQLEQEKAIKLSACIRKIEDYFNKSYGETADKYMFCYYDDQCDSGNNAFASSGYSDGSECLPEGELVGIISIGTNKDESRIDLVGHEYTHRVEGNISGMNYRGESGAIMEGYSDIFGELLELSINGDKVNPWIHGTGKYQRNLIKPEKSGNPSMVDGENYETTVDNGHNDHGNVHKNSTIISHAAYLMWNGIDGNEQKKISTALLGEIWYRALRFLHVNSTFSECADAVYKAAKTFQDVTAEQKKCIKEAFQQVGVSASSGIGARITPDAQLIVYDTNLQKYDNYSLQIKQIVDNKFKRVNNLVFSGKVTQKSYPLNLSYGLYEFIVTDNDPQGSKTKAVQSVQVGDFYPDILFKDVSIYTDFGVAKISDFTIPDDKICTIGQIDIIEPETVPADAEGYSLQWTSSNENVATVTPNGSSGTINPIAKGETDITATLVSGGKTIEKTTHLRVASKGRDTVLVLDVSGSMSGAPMEEMKKAAIQFCDDLIAGEYNNRVGLVLYDSQVDSVDLTNDLNMLKAYINGLSAGSTTNMEGGLSRAIGMLNDQGAENSIKNIVIMADGLPNEGATSYSGSMPTDSSYTLYSADLAYANAVIDAAKDAASRSYNVYSLGFFHTINPGAEYNFASTLMKNITNMDDGYHEVERVEDLQFQFADVQKDISNGAKTIINIACPVDVSVSYNGETLSSNADSFNDTASFGSLQLLGKNKDVKVLSLEPGIDYDIQMNGTGQGTMDYTVNYIDDDENIEDYRSFESVPITPTTKIDSNTNNSDVVKLNVDENGDGKVDQVWSANKNSTTKQEDQKKESKKPVQKKESLPTWVIVLIIVGAVLLILILVLCIVLAKNKKKAAQARPLPQKRPNPNPQPVRPSVAPVMPSYQKQGTIVFTSGEYKGARITLKEGDEVIMGKDSKISSIVFSEASISRKHCSIRMVGGEFILNDYSTNGVYSSLTKTKLKLAGASYTLHDHEAITLSKTNNTFYCE